MIKSVDINKIAIEKGVREKQIEKDQVISWVLWGIARNEFLNNNLVFKDTCLKKMILLIINCPLIAQIAHCCINSV